MESSQISPFSTSPDLLPGHVLNWMQGLLQQGPGTPVSQQLHLSASSLPWEKALSQAMLYFLITPGVLEIGEMMGLDSKELERALCSRTMATAKEKVVTALNVVQVRGPMGGPDSDSVLWLPH